MLLKYKLSFGVKLCVIYYYNIIIFIPHIFSLHLKCHGEMLFKCGHCLFYHWQKRTAEKHVAEKHSDRKQFVRLAKKNSVSELNLGKKVECKKDRRLLARHVGRKKNFIFKSYRTEFGNLFKNVTLGINPRVAEACRGRLILQLLLRNDFAWNIIPVFSLPNRLRKKKPSPFTKINLHVH